jgi:ElaB/YqjD/DUF883 family membrane-anchored ribosome-binding protein
MKRFHRSLPPKKTKSVHIADNATITTTGTSDSSTDVDLSTFTDELAKIRQESEDMQKKLQEQFQAALHDLEIRMEQRTQNLVSTMGQTLTQAIDHMNNQTAKSEERMSSFLTSFQAQADRMTAQMDRMMNPSASPSSPDGTPIRRTKERINSTIHTTMTPSSPIPRTTSDMEDDDNDDITVDGNRTSHASRASHPTYGMDATTGGRK